MSLFTIMPILFLIIFTFTAIMIVTITTKIFKNAKNAKPTDLNNQQTDQMEKMATMMGKVAVDMAKEMNPEYKALKCPNCGAGLTDDVEVCEYCDAPLTKVVATKK